MLASIQQNSGIKEFETCQVLGINDRAPVGLLSRCSKKSSLETISIAEGQLVPFGLTSGCLEMHVLVTGT
jgi:hypothetical protein